MSLSSQLWDLYPTYSLRQMLDSRLIPRFLLRQFSVNQFFSEREFLTPSEVASVGHTLEDIASAGWVNVNHDEMHEALFAICKLKQVNLIYLKRSDPRKLMNAGYTMVDFRMAGLGQRIAEVFPPSMLRAEGFSPEAILNARGLSGISIRELLGAGYSQQEIVSALKIENSQQRVEQEQKELKEFMRKVAATPPSQLFHYFAIDQLVEAGYAKLF